MTPTQPFTLPATLYRYQPAPGHREGLGASAPLPGFRASGIRLGTGVSRHRPGPLTDTPKDHGHVTFDPYTNTLTFTGSRTTRTWDMNKVIGTFTHPTTTPAGPQGPKNPHDEILYFQTTQRQTVEGLTAALATDPTGTRNPFNPTQTYTLSNLLFNTPPTPQHEAAAQARAARTKTARKAAFWTALALTAAALTGNYLAHTPSLAQQAGACDTPEEIATATAAGRALEAEAYTAAGRTRPSDARLYTYTDNQEGC